MPLSYRLSVHKSDYKRYTNGKTKSYMSSYEIIKHGDYKIELIEECHESQKIKKEKYYIENNNCVNILIPTINTTKDIKEYHYIRERITYECICGIKVRKRNSRHVKSVIHKQYIKNHNGPFPKNVYKCICGGIISNDIKKHIISFDHQEYMLNNKICNIYKTAPSEQKQLNNNDKTKEKENYYNELTNMTTPELITIINEELKIKTNKTLSNIAYQLKYKTSE
jgi:hypothetical protein